MAKISDVLIGQKVARGDGVACPGCGNQYLHHGEVTVFSRDEDAAKCLVTTIGVFGTNVELTDGKGNPSARRHGVMIEFSCEHCYAAPVLEIVQHKGMTYIEWRVV